MALLARHAGKSFAIHAKLFSVVLTIAHDGQLSIADTAIVPDVVIDVDLSQVNWAQFANKQEPIDIVSLTRVSGDAGLAQTVSTLLQSWRPDIEDVLAEKVGDVAARQTVNAVQSAGAAVLQSGLRVAQNVAEYLSYETGLLTPRPTQHALHATLNRVQDRVTGLEARLDRLTRLLNKMTVQSHSGQTPS